MTAAQPNLREQQRLQSRQRLLDAAIAEFADKGFDGASTREIAAQAGLPQSMIPYHFGGKDKLWREAVDALWARVDGELNAALDGVPESTVEYIRRGLTAWVRACARNPAYLRILMRESAQPGPRLDWLSAQHTSRHVARGRHFLAAAQARGLIPVVPTEHLAYFIYGGFVAVMAGAPEVERTLGVNPLDESFLERHVDMLMTLLFR